MPELEFLDDILILLGLALANAFFFQRMKLSPIIGYLATGAIIGPHGFHLIRNVHEVELLAEIGVILLLFTIGLEFSFSRILHLKNLMFRSGLSQVTATTALICLTAWLLGQPLRTALALGMILALSSTAIVLKLLMEKGEIDSAHGRVSLAILLFQDLCVVGLLIALPLLAGKTQALSWQQALQSLLIMAALFAFARYGLQPLLRGILHTRSGELFRIMVLVLVLGTAWITQKAGLSLALGAFLAGLALAESVYAHQVLSDILPFRDTFLAIFFISVGMLVDVQNLLENGPLILLLFFLLCTIKTVVASLSALWTRFPARTAMLVGLILFQAGEFSFILLKQAMSLDLLPESVYQVTLGLVAMTMMATPIVFPKAQKLADMLTFFIPDPHNDLEEQEESRMPKLSDHVIIAGYGIAGSSVAQVLKKMGIPYVVVELNGQVARKAKEAGESIIYGDSTSETVLHGLGIERAKALVLAVNDASALGRATRMAKHLNPDIYIMVRTKFVLEIGPLMEQGADEVLPDEIEASLQLAASVLQHYGVSEGKSLKAVAELRQQHCRTHPRPNTGSMDLSGYLSTLEAGALEFEPLPESSPCVGHSLAELHFRDRTHCTIVGIVRQEKLLFNPSATMKLEQGDTLILMGSEEEVAAARVLLKKGPDES